MESPRFITVFIVFGLLLTQSALADLPLELVSMLTKNTHLVSGKYAREGTYDTDELIHEVILRTYQNLLPLTPETEKFDAVLKLLALKKNVRVFIGNLDNPYTFFEGSLAFQDYEILKTILASRPPVQNCLKETPLFSIKSQLTNVSSALEKIAGESPSLERRTGSLPPQITVNTLFREIVIMNPDSDTFEGWSPEGLEGAQLTTWMRTAERNRRLNFLASSQLEVNVPAVNSKPIRITKETQEFFNGLPSGVPLNGSKVGIKYTFFPESVMDPGKYTDIGKPISFYLVKDTNEFSESDLGTVPSEAESQNWIQKYSDAAKMHHIQVNAYHAMGERHLKINPRLAAKYLKLSENHGHIDSAYGVGQLYGVGKGVKKDIEKAIKHLELAAKDEGLAALQVLGQEALKAGRDASSPKKRSEYYKIARRGYRTAAKKLGDPGSQNQYAYMLLEGLGGKTKPSEAAAWFARSAQNGNQTALNNLVTLAEDENVQAQLNLVEILRPGNPLKAREFAIKFANKGDPDVLNLAGVLLFQGEGGPRDVGSAVKYFSEAAQKGHKEGLKNLVKVADSGASDAQYQFAQILHNGRGVEVDSRLARSYLEKSAERNYIPALVLLGNFARDGVGGAVDLNLAVSAFRLAIVHGKSEVALKHLEEMARSGSALANRNLGYIYQVGKDLQKARHHYQDAADLGDVDSLIKLGNMWMNGDGGPKDIAKAIEVFERGAKLGDADSLNNLGTIYLEGLGVAPDFKKAKGYYEAAAEKGSATGIFHLGTMVFNGKGEKQDFAKAVEYFKAAALKGHVQAKVNLFVMFYHGQEVEKNLVLARAYAESAARDGHAASMHDLAIMLSRGDGGKKDPEASLQWLKLSSQHGYAPAVKLLQEIHENKN